MSNLDMGTLVKSLSSVDLMVPPSHLPEEVLCRIFNYLDSTRLCHASRVCSTWNHVLWARLRCLELDRKPYLDYSILGRLNEACQELTTLNISRCVSLRDSCGKVLFSMRLLRTLYIRYCDWITDELFEHLKTHPSLTELHVVASCRITLAEGKLSPQLKILTLSACRGLNKSFLTHLSRLNKLNSLDLSDCAPTLGLNEGISNLLFLPTLTNLSLRSTGLLNDSLQTIGELTNLKSLDLSHNPDITAVGIAHTAYLEKLTWLNLAYCPLISSPSLASLGRLYNLKMLNMNYTGAIDDGLDDLVPLPALETFKITGSSPNHIFLSGLSRSPLLHTLHLVNCQIDPLDFHFFASLTFLHHLDLTSACGVTDNIFSHLSRLINLQSLAVGSNYNITPAGIALLHSLPRLHSLNLSWSQKVTDSIGIVLTDFPCLSTLSLRSCKRITDASMPDLLKIPKLEVLDIEYCTGITKARQYSKEAPPRMTIRA